MTVTDGLDTSRYLADPFTEWDTGPTPERQPQQNMSTLFFSPAHVVQDPVLPVTMLIDCKDLVSHLNHMNWNLTGRRLIGDFEYLAGALESKGLETTYSLPREVIVADGRTKWRPSKRIASVLRNS